MVQWGGGGKSYGGSVGTTAPSPASGKYFKISFKGFSIFIKFLTLFLLLYCCAFHAEYDRNKIFAADMNLI
jgi:hypothetical protein